MTTATHEVIAPECWTIVHKATGQMLTDAWFNHERGQWTSQFDTVDPMTFPTREGAVDAFRAYRLDPRRVGLKRIRATVKLTDEGKSAVAARRAARNAERKFA